MHCNARFEDNTSYEKTATLFSLKYTWADESLSTWNHTSSGQPHLINSSSILKTKDTNDKVKDKIRYANSYFHVSLHP